jgi:uncharacterized repeat protein (TIGR01451 family)
MSTLISLLLVPALVAPIPPGYYDSVDASTPETLRATLHAVIDDHQRFPYTSGSTDTWDVLEDADQDPDNASNVRDVYLNDSIPKFGGGNGPYNREHTWPNSYGFSDDGSTNYPYTDCHALFLSDPSYNSSRGNDPYGNCGPGCVERPTMNGTTGVYPGLSNWRQTNTWETWIGRRGDVARAQLYMDIRYEGGNHGVTGAAEPDLRLTDDEGLIVTTGGNAAFAYHGRLSAILLWVEQDPVDAKEQRRNDRVAFYQGNRNPFIDHPEWIACLYDSICGDSPTSNLAISVSDGVATAVPGGAPIVYTLVASNAGPDAVEGVTVTDDFPGALSCSWTCSASAGSSCGASGAGDIGDSVDLLAGGTATYSATCQIASSATATLLNTATITAPKGTIDPPGNNGASDSTLLTPQADLAITKTDGVKVAIPGLPLTYTLVASNAGPSNASGSRVADTPPAACATFNWTCAGTGGGTCAASGSGAIDHAVTLPAGGSVTYTATCTVDGGATGTISNTATVATGATVLETNANDNQATDTDTVGDPPFFFDGFESGTTSAWSASVG